MNILKNIPGFLFITMSEPIKSLNFVRHVWITL